MAEMKSQAIQAERTRIIKEIKDMFREYRNKYPDANFDDAMGLLAGQAIKAVGESAGKESK